MKDPETIEEFEEQAEELAWKFTDMAQKAEYNPHVYHAALKVAEICVGVVLEKHGVFEKTWCIQSDKDEVTNNDRK